MPIYVYQARNTDGKGVKGKIESENEQNAIDVLKAQNCTLLNIRKLYFFEKDITLFPAKIGKDVLSLYCMQFSCMNIAGISLADLLSILHMQTTNKMLKRQIAILVESVLMGETLSASMKKTGKFPELLVSMTAVAEENNELSSIYEKMSRRYKREYKFEQDIKSAVAYPITVALLLLAVVIVAVVILIPNFSRIYEANEVTLPLATTILLSVSEFFVKNQTTIAIVFLVCFLALTLFLMTTKGKYVFDYFLVKMPLVKILYMKSVNAKFASVLALLTETGSSVPDAVVSAKQVLNNLFLNKILDDMVANVEKGENLADAVKASNLFDPVLYRMIAMGESAGQLSYVLTKCAENFDEATERAVVKANQFVGPLCVVVLGALVAFVMLAIMLPVFRLGQIL